jgi:hypothetical protein
MRKNREKRNKKNSNNRKRKKKRRREWGYRKKWYLSPISVRSPLGSTATSLSSSHTSIVL